MEKTTHRKKGWKVMAFALSLVLAVGLVPGSALAAEAEEKSGSQAGIEILEPELPQEAPSTESMAVPGAEAGTQAQSFGISPRYVSWNAISRANLNAYTRGSLVLNKTVPVSVTGSGYAPAIPAFYRIVLSKPGLLSFTFSGIDDAANVDCGLVALPAASTSNGYLLKDWIENSGTGSFNYLDWYLPRGTYYLKIDSDDTTSFYVRTKFTASKESFAEPLGGNNNTRAKAKTIATTGKYYYGLIGDTRNSVYKTDKVDYLKFRLTYTTGISIRVNGGGALRGASYRILDSRGRYKGTGRYGKTLTGDLAKGIYYLEIGSSSAYVYNAGGNYNVTVKTGPKLTMKFIDQKKGKIKLSWSKYSGAKKYVVYRSTNYGRNWKKIKTLGATARSYTTSVPKGKFGYCYKIQALGAKNVKSPYSAAYKITWRYY